MSSYKKSISILKFLLLLLQSIIVYSEMFEYYERARLFTVDSHRQSAYISKGGPGVRVVLFCENDWHFHEFGCVFVVTVSIYIFIQSE
jgi:hypothetical protein